MYDTCLIRPEPNQWWRHNGEGQLSVKDVLLKCRPFLDSKKVDMSDLMHGSQESQRAL